MNAHTLPTEADLGRAMLALPRKEGHVQSPYLRPPRPVAKKDMPEWVLAFLRLACQPEGVQNTVKVRARLRIDVHRETLRNWCARLADMGLLENDGGNFGRTYRATEAGKRRAAE